MAENESDSFIRLIEPGDRLTGLSLGDSSFTPLKTFIQKHAKDFQAKSLARTYGAFLQTGTNIKLIGYITLVCGEIVISEIDTKLVGDVDYSYLQYPAVKIARLATHSNYREQGIGKSLVELALGIAQDAISPAVGCRFVVVDAKKNAVDFYLKRGFSLLETEENKIREIPIMFVDLQKLTDK